MKFLSLCSGIEAASAAWHPLGWRAVAFAEIDKFPSAVLAAHYPEVPNWGDMNDFQRWPDADFNVLVGGTPCQSYSVAGLRKGLDDPRGDLMLGFVAVARRYRPAWVVWENVPGVLSSNSGRDFASLLGILTGNHVECPPDGWKNSGVAPGIPRAYGIAWRVLDAQFFGVPQRRRRVIVVGYLGNWRRAAAVLFECANLRGDSAPRRKTRQSLAPGVAGSLGGSSQSGGFRTTTDLDNHGAFIPEIANPLTHRMHKGINTTMDEGQTMIAFAQNQRDEVREMDVSGALAGEPGMKQQTFVRVPAIAFNWQNGGGYGDANEGLGISEEQAPPSSASQFAAVAFKASHFTRGKDGAPDEVVQPLSADADKGDQDTLIAFSCKDHGADAGALSPTLRGLNEVDGNANGGGQVAVAFESRFARNGRGAPSDVVPPLKAQSGESGKGDAAPLLATAMRVRRLTPRECSRLQGFPDDYLELKYADAKEAHAAQVLHVLWRATGQIAREGWGHGIVTALLAPEILLAGVHGGWVSWSVAIECAAASRQVQSADAYPSGLLQSLRQSKRDGRSPYRRESFKQCADELGANLSELPLEGTQACAFLRGSRLWPEAQRAWPLRYALASPSQIAAGRINVDSPRYKALGNSMAVPCMRWIGERIMAVEAIP